MKVPGSIYVGSEGREYLAVYTFFPDVYRAPPPSAKDSLHVAHVDYGYKSLRRAIDVFLLKSQLSHREVQINRAVTAAIQENIIAGVDIRNDIKYELLNTYPHNRELTNIIRQDIFDFTEEPAKKPTGHIITLTDIIRPNTQPRYIHPEFLLMGGKQEFVPSCRYEANLDFSSGCISGMVNGFLDVFGECVYCYAIYNHNTFVKYIVVFDKQQLKEELLGGAHLNGKDGGAFGVPITDLRLGKRTEAGSKSTLDSLVLTLETCLETGTRVIIPTKYLEYTKEISNLFKRTNSVVLYSIGDDKLERGACSHGCTNEFRLEQGARYKEDGTNAAYYLLIDVAHGPRERELKILEHAKRNNIQTQLLPMRIPSDEVALAFTGISWKNLKKDIHSQQFNTGVIEEKEWGGYNKKANCLVAQYKHPYWQELVGNNTGFVRMCHHDEKETYCGRCFLDDKGFIIPTEHVDIDYSRVRKANWKRKRFNKTERLL